MSPAHRVLVVGTGSIGERHVRAFAATGRAQLALCEVDRAVRERVARQYGVDDAYEDLATALAMRPDVVVVATPAHLHVPLAMAAASAGAHLLIEKPLGTSLDGVDELASAIQSRGLTAAVAYVYRCHPALSAMRTAILQRQFGMPVEIVATCGQHFPLYRPAYREIYYRDRSTGGGAVQDALTHLINAAEWLAGPIDRLVADADHQVLPGVSVEDTVHVLARHGQAMGSYALNQHQAPNEMTISVICTDGMARFEYHNNRWQWMREPGGNWTDEDAGPIERDTLFVRQAAAILDAVEGRALPPCSLDEARQTLAANMAILRSAERCAWETI
jgi:predicted dehydrogenase